MTVKAVAQKKPRSKADGMHREQSATNRGPDRQHAAGRSFLMQSLQHCCNTRIVILQRRYYLSAGMRKNSPFSGTAPSQSFGRVTQTCRRLPFHTVYGNANEVWRIKSVVRCRPVTVILSVLQQSVSWLIRPTTAILCKVIAKIAYHKEQERRRL